VDTAATAVSRLAADDPQGRHICYRAFVTGDGWTKPVCDGTLAGTVGQSKPIRALNFAEYGGDGMDANAFIYNPLSTNGEGKWSPKWAGIVPDKKDIYVGSSKKDSPNMLGFAVNIGKGQICQSAHVHDEGWHDRGCAGPRTDLEFGGTLNNSLWLEAVKLTL
jgi:hypothetical protein